MFPTSRSGCKGRVASTVVFLPVSIASVSAVPPAPKTAPYRITGIQAKLFYDTNGTFSRDVLAAPTFTFWNTVIGEGDAEAPSSSTLVLVEVTGEAGTAGLGARKLIVTATAGGKVLLNRTGEIGLFSAEGKYYAGFWLYGTGCQPVKITARITGQAPVSTKTATIPFACGE